MTGPFWREDVLDTAPFPAVAPHAAARSRAKRALDIAVSLVAVLIVIPLLLVIAVVLKLTAGEVIYRAPRIGRDGQLFTMFKFVTMTRGDTGPRVTGRGDLRITEVGRWLRATKLNELPQLFNVIKGEMSVVGPRPEDPRYAAYYSAHHRPVLDVRPGMTSRAFLSFGDEEEFIARARPDRPRVLLRARPPAEEAGHRARLREDVEPPAGPAHPPGNGPHAAAVTARRHRPAAFGRARRSRTGTNASASR